MAESTNSQLASPEAPTEAQAPQDSVSASFSAAKIAVTISILSVATSIYVAYQNDKSTTAALEAVEIAKSAAKINSRPRLAYHVEGRTNRISIKNIGDYPAISVRVFYYVATPQVSATGTELLIHIAQLQPDESWDSVVPVARLALYLGAVPKSEKVVVLGVSYIRESDGARFIEGSILIPDGQSVVDTRTQGVTPQRIELSKQVRARFAEFLVPPDDRSYRPFDSFDVEAVR